MSRVTSKPKKQPNVRAPLNHGSVSEVVLNFLYMLSKTNAYGQTTLDYLFELNPDKYKSLDALRRSLERLQKMGFVQTRSENNITTYLITPQGKTVPSIMAFSRKAHNTRTGIRDDD